MAVLIHVDKICKSHGAVTILEDATASFGEGQKIGMIGRNGAGKSTLCRIIIGQEESDSGKINLNSELRLSYLEQHDSFGPEESVIQFLMRFSGREEWECAEIAGKFQLKNEILDTQITALPGGFRTRVKLSAMLLRDPNFLILDEPSNYLDLATLILLENFLQDFNGGYLIVSHDREFLKRTCDHTLEVEYGRLTMYPGNIEDYFEFKEEQLTQKMAYNKTVEKKREQLQDFIDRFKAKASTASRAKSKMKMMDKLETIEILHPLKAVTIKIPSVERKAGIALSCSELSIGYPEKTVASGVNIEIDRGEKVAVLGDNGQGKTTFLKTIVEELAPKGGTVKWGSGLKLAYYAQHVFSTLHPQDDVYSHLSRQASEGVTHQDILDIAGAFLFKGDDVKKKVSVLSGGERARACLAGLLLTKSHVLLLDEPTNHLDFETVEALARALKSFEGTIFFICHDRTFVNMIATNIVEVKDGRIRRYPGTYEEYVYHLEQTAHEADHLPPFKAHPPKKQDAVSASGGTESSPAGPGAAADQAKIAREEAKALRTELNKIKSKMEKLDSRIKHLTEEKTAITEEINKNPFNFSRERNDKLRQVTVSLEDSETEWIELQEKYEKLQKKMAP